MRWLAALFLAGCAENVRVVEIKVPVEVARTPPDELLNCTSALPIPRFDPAPVGALLTDEQIPVLQSLIASLYGCDAGWRAWATHDEAEAP